MVFRGVLFGVMVCLSFRPTPNFHDYIREEWTKDSENSLKLGEHTLPETNSSPLKIGLPKRKGSSSNHQFSGALAVSFREGITCNCKYS